MNSRELFDHMLDNMAVDLRYALNQLGHVRGIDFASRAFDALERVEDAVRMCINERDRADQVVTNGSAEPEGQVSP